MSIPLIHMELETKQSKRLGPAWLLLTFAFALHVLDEALTGFLTVYNPTVAELRSRYSWFPMPQFTFETWLTSMICFLTVLFALSPLFFRNVRWIRPLGYFMAWLHLINAFGHTLGTITGQTVASVHFARPAPGFYTSPLLLMAALYLLHALAGSRGQHLGRKPAGAA